MASKFNVGDKVKRLQNIYKPRSRLVHGIVTEVYERTDRFGHYPELYRVKWNDPAYGNQQSFLPHGLDHD